MAVPLRDVATYTGAQTDAVLRATAAGVMTKVMQLSIKTSYACTVNTDVTIEWDDGTDIVLEKWEGIPPGGGIACDIGIEGGDGMDVLATCTAPTGGSVVISISSTQRASA